MSESLRGHPIYHDGRQWRFADDDSPTVDTWRERPCGHCGLPNTPTGHDGCLGELPGVVNACCGHGCEDEAYIQFADGRELRGRDVLTLTR